MARFRLYVPVNVCMHAHVHTCAEALAAAEKQAAAEKAAAEQAAAEKAAKKKAVCVAMALFMDSWSMHRWMDGSIDRLKDGWMKGSMERSIDRCMDIYGWMDECMDGQMDAWMHVLIDG